MNRLAIAFFYDKDGVVDDYFPEFVRGMMPFVNKTILVSNGPLNRAGEAKLKPLVDELIIRENVGFDVWAYKEALESVGYDGLQLYDEVILYNHTNYGPIFPFSEMFSEMESRDCDFWGITDHDIIKINPFTNFGTLPYHLNSHFVAIRQTVIRSTSFEAYWRLMPKIESYSDSIVKHESRFTKHFEDLGFVSSVYISCRDMGTTYPLMLRPDEMMLKRCPIMKRRLFFGDTDYLETNAADATRAIDILRATSDYDEALIWRNAARTAKLRTLNVNATLMTILPDQAEEPARDYGKIAVCAHMYYTDMLPEILSYTDNIPGPYDFIATTDTPAKKAELDAALAGHPNISNFFVRVVERNRGRDMSSLFITCRDLFIDDRYDLVCRLHTKKTPQVEAARGEFFKRHMLRNLLSSKGYTTNLLNTMSDSPWIGLVIPPIVHMSYYTIGHSWYNNRPRFEELVEELNLHVNIDETTPVAPYGTMFWFRPAALRKLFQHPWKWEDFDKEPHHRDGSLAHALERSIAYVAQDAGYVTLHASDARCAAQGYTLLEHKFDLLTSAIPTNSAYGQRQFLLRLRDAGYTSGAQGIVVSFKNLIRAFINSYRFRILRQR